MTLYKPYGHAIDSYHIYIFECLIYHAWWWKLCEVTLMDDACVSFCLSHMLTMIYINIIYHALSFDITCSCILQSFLNKYDALSSSLTNYGLLIKRYMVQPLQITVGLYPWHMAAHKHCCWSQESSGLGQSLYFSDCTPIFFTYAF